MFATSVNACRCRTICSGRALKPAFHHPPNPRSKLCRRGSATLEAGDVVGARSSSPAAAREVVSSKPVAFWLFGTAGAVAAMVTVGGVTRLTRSGLSMTDWRLQGSLPPRTIGEWEAEFARYKRFPEYSQRRSMTLDDFKFIYWWEYSHRMLGRSLGFLYVLPLAYFAARGRIPPHLRGKLAALLALGGGQGFVGWWMVRSGLEASALERREVRVSPYRLAAHLGVAFVTFSLLVHTGLEALHGAAGIAAATAEFAAATAESAVATALTAARSGAAASLRALDAPTLVRLARLRTLGGGAAALAFVTALSGAFVAGNDAGRAYNVFPWMTEDRWLPEEILELQPLWRNFFENTATVQADHRVLALSAVAAAIATFAYARGTGGGALWAALPRRARRGAAATAALAAGQAGLGISTLLLYVPVPLAAAHQAGALALLGSSVYALHGMRFARGAGASAAAVGARHGAVAAVRSL